MGFWYKFRAFFQQISTAIDNYRYQPTLHLEIVRTAMTIDASWDTSAAQYVEMYRYGLLVKQWQEDRQCLIEQFVRSLKGNRELFARFFIPGQQEYGDRFDWQLKETL